MRYVVNLTMWRRRPDRRVCGVSGGDWKRSGYKSGVQPAHHRASRRLYPRAAMIAPDFALLRVLATGIIAPSMVEGACARKRAKDKRGRGQRSLYPEGPLSTRQQLRKKPTKSENSMSGLVQYAG